MTDNSHKKKNITIETDDNISKKSDEQEPVEAATPLEINQTEETENTEQLKKQLEEAKQEIVQEHDRFLRLSAEFENYKKRMNRQMDDFRKYANEALLKDLLFVVDNLERALNTSGEDTDESMQACLTEGVEMTLNEILKILSKFNVTPIESLEKPFDPVFHEAVMQEESDGQPENTVINEFQKGYLIHDRLLRPSMVVVSKGKS
ncbi:MAG: nucleotide exchange factor GrpE [Desulfobacteraceae bacterium]|nr:nucleotide exchange factor GrpE [Desulfobacteraceae bacterium]MBC2757017.1 nucleotide exchange factor GrpE [Desulfobacteraceae bacterium]